MFSRREGREDIIWKQPAILTIVALFTLISYLMLGFMMNEGFSDDRELLFAARNLTPEAVEKLEDKIKDDPEDFESRVKLLGYYFRQQFRSPLAATSHQKLAMWIIEHHPGSEVAGSLQSHILNHRLHNAAFEKGKTLWLKNIENHPQNPQILGNAAGYFLLSDRETAEECLVKAQKLEPKNPQWSSQLAQLYKLQMTPLQGEKKKKMAAKALAEFERSYNLQPVEVRDYALSDMAKTAFEAAQYDKAEKFAKKLLATVSGNNGDWNTGNAIHQGNLILGRIALKDDKLEAAKEHLIASGKTPGSPQLNSFGPNMQLAKELLERGESETVLKYFNLCGNFWEKEKLKTWEKEVLAGETPKFGANLVY